MNPHTNERTAMTTFNVDIGTQQSQGLTYLGPRGVVPYLAAFEPTTTLDPPLQQRSPSSSLNSQLHCPPSPPCLVDLRPNLLPTPGSYHVSQLSFSFLVSS